MTDGNARSERIDENINPRRYSIVGATGSGKTHLARALSAKLRLPLRELDGYRWDSSGGELPIEDFIEAVRGLVASEQWIIDGHYREVRHLIWGRAEVVVWLNYPLPLVAARLLRRFARKRKAANPPVGDRAADANLDRALPRVTWADRVKRLARTMKERGEYRRLLNAPKYRHLRIVELKSVRSTDEWLRATRRPR